MHRGSGLSARRAGAAGLVASARVLPWPSRARLLAWLALVRPLARGLDRGADPKVPGAVARRARGSRSHTPSAPPACAQGRKDAGQWFPAAPLSCISDRLVSPHAIARGVLDLGGTNTFPGHITVAYHLLEGASSRASSEVAGILAAPPRRSYRSKRPQSWSRARPLRSGRQRAVAPPLAVCTTVASEAGKKRPSVPSSHRTT